MCLSPKVAGSLGPGQGAMWFEEERSGAYLSNARLVEARRNVRWIGRFRSRWSENAGIYTFYLPECVMHGQNSAAWSPFVHNRILGWEGKLAFLSESP